MAETGLSLPDIDLSDLELGADADFTSAIDTDVPNSEITSIFPHAPVAETPAENFFTAQQSSTAEKPPTTSSPPVSAVGGGEGNRKARRAAKGKQPNAAAAAVAKAAFGDDDDEDGDAKKKAMRKELKERLKTKRRMAALPNHAARLLGQMESLSEAAEAEARGKPIPASKQQELLRETQGLFRSVVGGTDPKQRAALAKKLGGFGGVAGNLSKKLVSGPGQRVPDTEDEDNPADFDGKLDPTLNALVRGVHDRQSLTELPLRPRRKATVPTADVVPQLVSSDQDPPLPTADPAKAAKNKRKREKQKAKIKALKAAAL
jgi:hypothetical protein